MAAYKYQVTNSSSQNNVFKVGKTRYFIGAKESLVVDSDQILTGDSTFLVVDITGNPTAGHNPASDSDVVDSSPARELTLQSLIQQGNQRATEGGDLFSLSLDTDFAPTTGVYVGTAGDLSVVGVSGVTVILKNVPAGTLLRPLKVTRVTATGTTATDLVGWR